MYLLVYYVSPTRIYNPGSQGSTLSFQGIPGAPGMNDSLAQNRCSRNHCWMNRQRTAPCMLHGTTQSPKVLQCCSLTSCCIFLPWLLQIPLPTLRQTGARSQDPVPSIYGEGWSIYNCVWLSTFPHQPGSNPGSLSANDKLVGGRDTLFQLTPLWLPTT